MIVSSFKKCPIGSRKKLSELIFRGLSAVPLTTEEAGSDDDFLVNGPRTNSMEFQSDVTINRPRLEALRSQLREEEKAGRRGHTIKIHASQHSRQDFDEEMDRNKSDVRNLIQTLKELPPDLKSAPILTDNYNRHHSYLRISLSERCNLRCRYCMPPDGVPLQPEKKLLNSEEILNLTSLFAENGVNKIRLTGGEPLLRRDLVDIVAGISNLNHNSSSSRTNIKSIGITTNGITLSRHIADLSNAGLTHVNISLDTLNEEKFEYITRRPGLKKVLRAIDDATNYLTGEGRLKINCVVMKGVNDTELSDFVMLTKDRPVDVRFIEWMPFNDNGWNADRFFSYEQMLNRISDSDIPLPLERTADSANDTTKWYQAPGHAGRVGFITSMSEHFCGTCNRLRITADGQLKVCLFGNQEVSLRDALRLEDVSREDLMLLIGAAVRRKKFALGGHGDMFGIKKANNNRPMTLIGG